MNHFQKSSEHLGFIGNKPIIWNGIYLIISYLIKNCTVPYKLKSVPYNYLKRSLLGVFLFPIGRVCSLLFPMIFEGGTLQSKNFQHNFYPEKGVILEKYNEL